MKRKTYILLLLFLPVLSGFGQGSQVNSTVQTFSGAYYGVYGELTFNTGFIITPRNSPLTSTVYFTDGSTHTGESDVSYVNGYATKKGDDAFTFPVGDQDGADLRTLSISAPSSATDELIVAYWKGDAGTGLDPTGGAHSLTALNTAGTAGSTQLFSVSPIGFWDWIPASGTSALTVSVSIPDFAVLGGYGTPADMRMVGWNTITNVWDNLSGATGASSNAEGTVMTGTVSDMSMYSAIAIGNVSSLPLPVKLLSFTVKKEGSTALLNWSTTEETNADRFDIQRSSDARNWNTVGEQKAAGESKTLLSYQFTDTAPVQQGLSYYRLKMIDLDGTFAYSSIKSVTFENGSASLVSIYPNPVSEVFFLKDASGGVLDLKTVKEISITNLNGITAYKTSAAAGGININSLTNGVYIVKVTKTDGTASAHKIVITK